MFSTYGSFTVIILHYIIFITLVNNVIILHMLNDCQNKNVSTNEINIFIKNLQYFCFTQRGTRCPHNAPKRIQAVVSYHELCWLRRPRHWTKLFFVRSGPPYSIRPTRLRRPIRTVYIIMFTRTEKVTARRRWFRMLSDCYNVIILYFLLLLFSLVGYHRPTSCINSDLYGAHRRRSFQSYWVYRVRCTWYRYTVCAWRVCVRVRCARSEPPTVSTSQFSTPK